MAGPLRCTDGWEVNTPQPTGYLSSPAPLGNLVSCSRSRTLRISSLRPGDIESGAGGL